MTYSCQVCYGIMSMDIVPAPLSVSKANKLQRKVCAFPGEERINMKFKNPMLVVEDLEKAAAFYKDVLGLQVILDFGSNITLTGGISMQSKESWEEFIQKKPDEIVFGANNAELYFEEDEFDAFLERLDSIGGIEYVQPMQEYRWGQRGVRIYDADRHIIEIGENIGAVCRRFLNSGMSIAETAIRMDVSEDYVRDCIK